MEKSNSNSKVAGMQSSEIPEQVVEVLKNTSVGYLSVISKKGDLYGYPIAFHYSDMKVYFMTPVSAAKYKFIKANPTVSLVIDNKKLTTEACGAMVQGRAKIFTIGRTIMSILSIGPKIAGFARKYPGMLTFYARGKELPDERKIYKYRLIRIDPTKIVYWLGYTFGRYIPKALNSPKRDPLAQPKNESEISAAAELLQSADEELPKEELPTDHDWLVRLDEVASRGILSEEERAILGLYRSGALGAQDSAARTSARVTDEEKRLLKKMKD